MRVKEPICEKCFYDIYPRRELTCVCLTKRMGICSQCGLKDHMVVDYILHNEKYSPDDLVMQTGLMWRKIKW